MALQGNPSLARQCEYWTFRNAEQYDTATELAEAAADWFGHYEWLDEEQHFVWEHALSAMNLKAEQRTY